MNGTSFAAPVATGIAALLLSVNSSLYNDDIEQIIRLGVEDKGDPGFDNLYGTGRVNARAALDLIRLPNVVKQWTASGGSSVSSTNTYTMVFFSTPGLATGIYIVKRYDVRKTVSFPQSFISTPYVWGRGVATNGYSAASPNFGMGWCNVVSGSETSTGVTLQTYVYKVWNIMGQYLGYYPTSPSNVTFAYTALEENPPPSTPTNFYGTGGQGQNPTLHWDSVVEPDIDYLELKRTVTGQGGGNRVFTLSPGTTQYTDNTVIIDKFGFATIKYKLRSVDYASQYSGYTNTVTYSGEGLWKQMADFEIIPEEYALHAAFPNPFNPSTSIRFDLPERSRVSMIIYDVLGRTVRTLVQDAMEPGFNEIRWGGKDDKGNPVPTGMYIYRFSAFSEESDKQFNKSNKLVLMK